MDRFYCAVCHCELEIDERTRGFYKLIADLDGTGHICKLCKENCGRYG